MFGDELYPADHNTYRFHTFACVCCSLFALSVGMPQLFWLVERWSTCNLVVLLVVDSPRTILRLWLV